MSVPRHTQLIDLDGGHLLIQALEDLKTEIYGHGFVAFPAQRISSSDPTTLDDYREGYFDLKDGSGVGLAMTITKRGVYTKIGRLVVISFGITYPTTADTTNARLLGFPFNANAASGGAPYYTNYGNPISIVMEANTPACGFYSAAAVQLTNANLSTIDLRFTVSYFV